MMPELPDVKVFEQHASARSLDRNVAHVHVRDQTLLRGVTRQKLASQLVGGKPIILYIVGQSFNIILTLAMAWVAFGGVLFEAF